MCSFTIYQKVSDIRNKGLYICKDKRALWFTFFFNQLDSLKLSLSYDICLIYS